MIKVYRLLLVLIMGTLLLFPAVARAQNNFEVVAENRELLLYMDKTTTEIAVQKKETGSIWYSNPQKREEVEELARGRTRGRLSAQLKIDYFTPEGRRKSMNNFTDSIEHQQYEITLQNQGVRIDYELGEKWKPEDIIPAIIN
ncbi:MAG: hypothetical protein ACOCQ1_05425, partial [Halanaerobiaceae bacterium]